MIIFLVKMLIAGVISSLPTGPVGVFAVEEGVRRGFWAVVTTFAGALVIDAIFATLLLTGRHIASIEYVLHGPILALVGSCIIIGVGYVTFRGVQNKKEVVSNKENMSVSHTRAFFTALVMNATNPTVFPALVIILTALEVLTMPITSPLAIPLGVMIFSCGALSVWVGIAFLVGHYKERHAKIQHYITKLFGGIIMAIGIVSFCVEVFRIVVSKL